MKSQIIDGKKTRFQLKNHSRKKTKYYSEDDLPTDKMISCHSCRTAFLSSNPSLTCENCRMKNSIVLPFSFNPKKNLQLNGFRKNPMKFPTANGQSVIQSTGEVKFRPRMNSKKSQCFTAESTNLKRKRTNSSTLDSPWQSLYRLFHSCRSEEFHGPVLSSNNSHQISCFICRKSSIKHGPTIHCDYCPLIYHLTCLTARTLPIMNEKWMCPNHMTPILDRHLARKSHTNRVKIYHQYPQMDEHCIIQDFTSEKATNIIQNYQFERIDISQIPMTIKEFYSQAKIETICNVEIPSDRPIPIENQLTEEDSSTYDPSIWDILQAILDQIINGQPYQFSSDLPLINSFKSSSSKSSSNTLDTIDTLLAALTEPNVISPNLISSSLISPVIDLTQFRLSHAALIHRRSNTVIYIRKHVIWFGTSSSNEICLENFHSSHTCSSIAERHACLYYDERRHLFELLNYSEYGTIVNNIRYGIGLINEDSCWKTSTLDETWDGPATIEQGTVIQIGCHEFLFYRHIVR